MDCDLDDHDCFDWEAAAAAIDSISLLGDEQKNFQKTTSTVQENQISIINKEKYENPVVRLPLSHAKLQQKSILNFVQRPNSHSVNNSHVPQSHTRTANDSKQHVLQSNQHAVEDLMLHDARSNQDFDLTSHAQRFTRHFVSDSKLHDNGILDNNELSIDLDAAKTWIYPVNVPMRDYQFSIVQTALFSNTLVSLPTGLGKTLIAAVVMFNYFRWFPKGKIVFTAPSRPLVLQQIEACHDSVCIPQEWTIDMTGQMNPAHRSANWHAKRVFFVTPQVFEKDIESGSCPLKDVVCLVIDEAHRAMGNYSYCVVVRKLIEACVRFRLLALTATPGSKQDTIQAVVDNLHISCLEYRSENDSDVRKYIHNKKLELLQVPMDSESVKIKDLFLEILQPLVNRLCGFGVFYSKEAARLAPYEFLTARDKFRQAPPPGLDPRQFNEVEACFGATITLYHTFKLLFSHGIRPAYEMLKQKLESGPFARLMGRNEVLHQIKLLMEKHVRNGASSPKLIKLRDLMTEHFTVNDPMKSRVIIFTNFRESVKDILETLKILGDTVKAMDFIGQSSGKSSKGQSQKVQQAVLQKFRMGGFNTIVATSIAEEGLDIMEVDLVICFDANISPLRMIQRMGRTGRKRDGRVIVLASEGAEAQGYLKKQAKSKALGKHMHNGGINSFNFHPSARMVPHSIKPEVQLIELSIIKFVPRVKNKPKIEPSILDPGSVELTVEETLSLRRYIEPHQSASCMWKPSLIAFPHCQLVPTKVHNVRHSGRTISMLIDTLQSLHEYKERRYHDSQFPNLLGNDYSEDNTIEEVQVSPRSKAYCTPEMDVKHVVSIEPDLAFQFAEGPSDDLEPENEQHSVPVALESTFQIDLKDKLPPVEDQLDPAEENIYSNHNANIPNLPFATRCESQLSKVEQSLRSKQCIFFEEIVSVGAGGYVQIASPPSLPLEGVLKCYNRNDCQACNECPGPATLMSCNELNFNGIFETGIIDQPRPNMSQQKAENFIPVSPGCVVASTPEEKIPMRGYRTTPETNFEDMNYYSPRLCSLADQGIVPLSPGLELAPISSPIVKDACFMRHDKNMQSVIKPIVKIDGSSDIFLKRLQDRNDNMDMNRRMSAINITSADGDISSKVLGDEPSGLKSTILQTPTVHLAIDNGSLNLESSSWMKPLDASSSGQKPKKFRRLRKAKDGEKKFPHRSEQPCQRLGKQRLKFEAAILIDEEAEVSSDGDVSADEDDAEDEIGSLQDFIDDEVEPTVSTSGGCEPIDMMAIYRKSLLTPSPLAGEMISWMRRLEHSATPASDASLKVLSSNHSESRLLSTSAGEGVLQSATPTSVSVESAINKSVPQTVTCLDPHLENSTSIYKNTASIHEPTTTKIQERKRKLSFQQEDMWDSRDISTIGTQFDDDDPFSGIDLDALEVEAVQMSRSHVQGQMQSNNIHTNPQKNEDVNLEFLPSFNLGFDS